MYILSKYTSNLHNYLWLKATSSFAKTTAEFP